MAVLHGTTFVVNGVMYRSGERKQAGGCQIHRSHRVVPCCCALHQRQANAGRGSDGSLPATQVKAEPCAVCTNDPAMKVAKTVAANAVTRPILAVCAACSEKHTLMTLFITSIRFQAGHIRRPMTMIPLPMTSEDERGGFFSSYSLAVDLYSIDFNLFDRFPKKN